MNRSEKKELLSEIKDVKVKNIEEIFLISFYCAEAYLKCLMTFGINSTGAKEIVKLWKDFIAIQKEESKIHSQILKKMSAIELDNIIEFLEDLDELNENTVEYFYTFLDEALDACDINREHRIKRNSQSFKTLIDDDKYLKELSELLISEKDVVNFLELPKEFVKYLNAIDERIIYINHHFEEDHFFYGVNYKTDDSNNLIDIKLFIPTIINLESALIYIYNCYCAYQLYTYLGSQITDEILEEITNNAQLKINEFTKKFEQQQKTLLLK